MGVSGRPDLICTNPLLVEQCVIHGAQLDLVIGDSNDFSLVTSMGLEVGSIVFVEGTEYAGIVDDVESSTTSDLATYGGRSWPGILDTRVVRPPAGKDYYTFDGDANLVIRNLIEACDLGELFRAGQGTAGITLSGRAARYSSLWETLVSACAASSARPSCAWDGSRLVLTCAATCQVEVDAVSEAAVRIRRGGRPVNHLVCLGQGELAEREVLDLYADESGNVSTTQTIFGAGVVEEVYDYSSASSEELLEDGMKRLMDLQETSPIAVDASDVRADLFLMDSIWAVDDRSGIEAAATVTRVVVRLEDGMLDVSYEAGPTSVTSGSRSSSSGGQGAGVAYSAGDGIDISGHVISVDATQLSYADLQDKPSIEAHELVGDSSLDDISVHRLTNSEIDALMALSDSSG